jgi:hypothetical protein
MPRRCPIREQLLVPRHEASGPVRQFRWSHHGKEDITIYVETSRPRAIQMIFGAEFGHQQSGYHGDFQEINRTTIFMNDVRYLGVHATWAHKFTFLKMATSSTQQWHCVGQPIVITELDANHIPLPHSSSPAAASSTMLTTLQQRYFPPMLALLGESSSASPPLPSSSASASSSSSSSAVATDSTSSSSSHPYTSMTWEKYIESLRV